MRQQGRGNSEPKMDSDNSGGRPRGIFSIRMELLKRVAGWETQDVARFLQQVNTPAFLVIILSGK
jgi:hypothetical protein